MQATVYIPGKLAEKMAARIDAEQCSRNELILQALRNIQVNKDSPNRMKSVGYTQSQRFYGHNQKSKNPTDHRRWREPLQRVLHHVEWRATSIPSPLKPDWQPLVNNIFPEGRVYSVTLRENGELGAEATVRFSTYDEAGFFERAPPSTARRSES